jgi:hypothetical protein
MATPIETINTAPGFLTSASLHFNICNEHSTTFTGETSQPLPDANRMTKRATQRRMIQGISNDDFCGFVGRLNPPRRS